MAWVERALRVTPDRSTTNIPPGSSEIRNFLEVDANLSGCEIPSRLAFPTSKATRVAHGPTLEQSKTGPKSSFLAKKKALARAKA